MQNLKRLILETLAICKRAGYPLKRHTLKNRCENYDLGRGSIGDGEFDDAMNELEAKRFISHDIEELTGDKLYYITDKGGEHL